MAILNKPTLNRHSACITQSVAQGHSQAMLYATGLTEQDMDKPQIALPACGTRETHATCTCSIWQKKCAMALSQADMVGMRFNTIGVSDSISMGTDGMSFSLPSRDIIADSIETIMSAQY